MKKPHDAAVRRFHEGEKSFFFHIYNKDTHASVFHLNEAKQLKHKKSPGIIKWYP